MEEDREDIEGKATIIKAAEILQRIMFNPYLPPVSHDAAEAPDPSGNIQSLVVLKTDKSQKKFKHPPDVRERWRQKSQNRRNNQRLQKQFGLLINEANPRDNIRKYICSTPGCFKQSKPGELHICSGHERTGLRKRKNKTV